MPAQPRNDGSDQQPPPGLTSPLGLPRPVNASLRTAVLVALCLVMVVPAAIGGHGMAQADGEISEPAPWLLLALVAFTALFLFWPGFVVRLRCDGRVLQGIGLLGRQRVDLSRLSYVASTVSKKSVVVQLRDDSGALMFDSRFLKLAGPAAVRVVGQAVWAGQQRGHYVIPRSAAQLWGCRRRPMRPSTRGRARSLASSSSSRCSPSASPSARWSAPADRATAQAARYAGQAGGAKNSSAIPSGSVKETPEP